MTKIAIGVLVVIVGVLVAVLTYTKDDTTHQQTFTQQETKQAAPVKMPEAKEEVSTPTTVSKKKVQQMKDTASKKVDSTTSEKVSVGKKGAENISTTQTEVADFSHIGEGLTLESIENSDASEEEKENMRHRLMLRESYQAKDEPSLTEEEGMKILNNL